MTFEVTVIIVSLGGLYLTTTGLILTQFRAGHRDLSGQLADIRSDLRDAAREITEIRDRIAQVEVTLTQRIARVEGPERIEPEWWAGGPEDAPRDYFRAEDTEGRRYWLFRAGLYRDAGSKGPPRWYIHGLYG